MLIWFLMLAVMGLLHFLDDWHIFKALNPYYAFDLLINYPKGFWILGAVFLCTTGAEACIAILVTVAGAISGCHGYS
jgi:KUP system potassium uptake protein